MGSGSHRLTDDSRLFLSAPLCLFMPDETDPPPCLFFSTAQKKRKKKKREKKENEESSSVCFHSSFLLRVVLLFPLATESSGSSPAEAERSIFPPQPRLQNNRSPPLIPHFLKDAYLTPLFSCSLSPSVSLEDTVGSWTEIRWEEFCFKTLYKLSFDSEDERLLWKQGPALLIQESWTHYPPSWTSIFGSRCRFLRLHLKTKKPVDLRN